MALKCCNKICQLLESVPLLNTANKVHRVLVIGRCKNPKCGCLKGEFIYWDKIQKKFIHESIPKKNLREIIQKYKKLPFLDYQKGVKYGTMANMNWKYQKNGNIYDFNNVLIQHLEVEMKKYEQN